MDSPMPSSLVEILDALDALDDPRGDRTKLHPLTDILVLSVLAVLCGTDSFVAIALFGQLNEEWLRTFLELPHGIPSHNTLGRVFARLDASGFEGGFRDWVQEAFELTEGQVVPVDGKSVRHALYMAALSVIRQDSIHQHFYQGLRQRGKARVSGRMDTVSSWALPSRYGLPSPGNCSGSRKKWDMTTSLQHGLATRTEAVHGLSRPSRLLKNGFGMTSATTRAAEAVFAVV